MFTILNRLRGSGWFPTPLISLIIIGILYFTTNIWLGIMTGIMYLVGESFGWGKWIGGIISKNTGPATSSQFMDKEGRDNGIHWLANKITPETTNYYNYCKVALTIRGLYWWSLAFLPLTITGHISILMFVLIVVFLGIAFPISVILGDKTSKLFTFETRYFSMRNTWEHSEVIYGVFQDIALIALLI